MRGDLRERLPEGAKVRVVRSGHEWLEPGMVGTIHWVHQTATNPTFQQDGWENNCGVSVQLVAPRDKIEVL